MNQKNVAIASGVLALVLVTGCSGSEKYEYQVSGKVDSQQIDYDCPGENLAIEPVAFGDKGGTSSGNANRSKPVETKPKKAEDLGKTESGAGGTGGTSTIDADPRPVVRKTSSRKTNKGVKLDKKPDSPQKVNKAKKSYSLKPKGCTNEYEIFVLDEKGDLYEQDVRQVDYDKCLSAKIPSGQKAKLFPLCTKG